MMILEYIKSIFTIWTSWIFALSSMLGIISQLTGKNYLFPSIIYWLIALVCFIASNIKLYIDLKKLIKTFEQQEANLTLKIKGQHFKVLDETPIKIDMNYCLSDKGLPIDFFFAAELEIENIGKEDGVFQWRIEDINLGKFFTLYPNEENGKIIFSNGEDKRKLFNGNVKGRNRITGTWRLRLKTGFSNPTNFAKYLHENDNYSISFVYWTKKIGGKGKEKLIIIKGTLADLALDMSERWEKRGWENIAKIVQNN